MKKILNQNFFDRPVLEVCPELLGKYLVIDGEGYMITEIEAYDGTDDQASHARHGKTERNATMFGHPGYWYIYLCYGMYQMLNIVTGPGKHPSAILIRGVEGFNGPGKLTKNLGITKKYNNKIANKKIGLWIEDRGVIIKSYTQKPRIGVDYAGEGAKKERRFLIK